VYRNTLFQSPTSAAIGSLGNGGTKRYLLEAESSTGFMAWKTADGTTLVNAAKEVSVSPSPSLSFWSCAGYQDTTPAGEITYFDCHDNALTDLDVSGLKSLEYLDCSCNELCRLSLNGLSKLQALDVNHNTLIALEVRNLRALRVLNCASNQLTALDLRGMDTLQILDCSDNRLVTLRMKGCMALKDVRTDRKPTR
jgi:hypothetical protein